MATNDQLKETLHALYADGSKHAVYQNVPDFVRAALGYHEVIDEGWRSDSPRYRYFARHLQSRPGAKIADVGANTGFFALNLAHAESARSVYAFEPNPNHRAFIDAVAKAFALTNLTTSNLGWTDATLDSVGRYDTVFLLNILHHAGFDFSAEIPDDNAAWESYSDRYLVKLHRATDQLCFQIGSNRGGDKGRPFFPFDDDERRLCWTAGLLHRNGWKTRHVGYAQRSDDGKIEYIDAPSEILAAITSGGLRDATMADFLRSLNLRQFPGEFYRRPLFICEGA